MEVSRENKSSVLKCTNGRSLTVYSIGSLFANSQVKLLSKFLMVNPEMASVFQGLWSKFSLLLICYLLIEWVRIFKANRFRVKFSNAEASARDKFSYVLHRKTRFKIRCIPNLQRCNQFSKRKRNRYHFAQLHDTFSHNLNEISISFFSLLIQGVFLTATTHC